MLTDAGVSTLIALRMAPAMPARTSITAPNAATSRQSESVPISESWLPAARATPTAAKAATSHFVTSRIWVTPASLPAAEEFVGVFGAGSAIAA